MARLLVSAAVGAVAFVASGYNPAVAAQAFAATPALGGAIQPPPQPLKRSQRRQRKERK